MLNYLKELLLVYENNNFLIKEIIRYYTNIKMLILCTCINNCCWTNKKNVGLCEVT
jgi:hypothetical protein